MAVIICHNMPPWVEKQWQERAYLLIKKKKGELHKISLKPADFSLCVTREESAILWMSNLRENTPGFWRSSVFYSHPVCCIRNGRVHFQNYVKQCWTILKQLDPIFHVVPPPKIIAIKEIHPFKERLSCLLSTHLPVLLFPSLSLLS